MRFGIPIANACILISFACLSGLAAANPALVCVPQAGVPITPAHEAAVSDGCGADLSPVCEDIVALFEQEASSGDTQASCEAVYMGDCEVTPDGDTVTAWEVSGALSDAGANDYMFVGLDCGSDNPDMGTLVASCDATNDTPCSDEGPPAPGGAYCIVVFVDDTSDNIPPENWSFAADCQDPAPVGALTGLF